MDLVTLPQTLLVFYGGVVLSCGAVLGFILGRSRYRTLSIPEPPDLLSRRVSLLEEELEDTRQELSELVAENRFLRELKAPRDVPQREQHGGARRIQRSA